MKDLGTKALMAIGFIVGGIGMARTFGDLPDDMKAVQDRLKKEEKPSEDKTE